MLLDNRTAELQARLESQLNKMAEAEAAVERAEMNRAEIELPPRPGDYELSSGDTLF